MKMNSELIRILDELFELFTYYRDYTFKYDGDPFPDYHASLEMLDEGRNRLIEVRDGQYDQGWHRFDELKEQYSKLMKDRETNMNGEY